MFRRALTAYADGFGAASAGLVADVLTTSPDPLVRSTAVAALQSVRSPVADAALATVPRVRVRAVDDQGAPVRNAAITATFADGRVLTSAGSLDRIDPTFPTGDARVTVTRGPCEADVATVPVAPDAPEVAVPLTAARPLRWAWTVVDDRGAPLTGVVRLTPAPGTHPACAPAEVAFTDGRGEVALGPGAWSARITANGHRFTDHALTARDADAPPGAFTLAPTVLRVEKGRIQAEPIYFEPGKAVITPPSTPATTSR